MLDRKLLRDLWGASGRLLAIICILGVGVSCYVALGSGYKNLNAARQDYYTLCRMADFSLDLKKAPVSAIASLGQLEGVLDLRPRIQFRATVDLESQGEPSNGIVLSLPNQRKAVINDILIRQGGYFTNLRENEVIVNDKFARQHGLVPGSWVHLLLNRQRESLMVVGTCVSSEFTYMVGPGSIAPDPEHFGVFYIKETYAEDVFDFGGAMNQVLGRVIPSHQHRVKEVLARAEKLLDEYGVINTTPLADQSSHRFLHNEIQGLGTFGRIIPTIFFATSALVLNILISRFCEQQRIVIGTFKAIGYSDGAVFLHILKLGLVVGIGGGLLGCLGGIGVAAFMTKVYRSFFEFPNLTSRFYPDSFAIGFLISIACGMLGAWNGARNILKMPPAESMRPKPPEKGGAIWLERHTWFWKQLPFGWRLAVRSIFRNRWRTLTGVFASAMGASVMVVALHLKISIAYLVDFQYEKVLRADVDLTFRDERGRDALTEVRHLPGVDHCEPVFDVPCTFQSGRREKKSVLTGLTHDPRLTMPRDSAGDRVSIPEDGILMTQMLADILQVRAGDYVTVTPIKGNRAPIRMLVSRVNHSFIGLSAYANIHFLSHALGEEFAMTGVQLQLHPDPEVRRNFHRELRDLANIQMYASREHMVYGIRETLIKNQQVFVMLLVGFAGVIFFGSQLNSSLIQLAERQREVASFRVLGYGPWQIGGILYRETAMQNILGTLVGLPFGLFIAHRAVEGYNTEMFRIPLVEPSQIFLLTFLLSCVFSLIAQAWIQWDIHRMDWLDALKTKE